VSDTERTGQSDRLSVEHRTVDGIHVVTLSGEIDHSVADVLSEALAPRAADAPRIVVDLGGVTFMDSSGINVLVLVHRSVTQAQGWLRLAAAQDPVLRVIRLVGLDTVIACHPTVRQALTS
jgi:anti-anti-sigma factor